MKIPASELPKQASGAIYHLNLFPEDIADNIILVGDPGRVPMVSSHFDTIDVKKSNRELFTHTGTKNGKRISVISTGMGTDNIEIVVTELDALVNVDLPTMTIKEQHHTLNLVRIGTSGSLQKDISPNTILASKFGFGLDGLLQFYENQDDNYEEVVKAFVDDTGWNERLPHPYCVPCSEELFQRIAFDMTPGITCTAPGFFAPQNREIRAKIKYPELKHKIEEFNYNGIRLTNMEMECSALYCLSKLLGHNALTCCLLIANRVTGAYLDEYHDQMDDMVEKVVSRI